VTSVWVAVQGEEISLGKTAGYLQPHIHQCLMAFITLDNAYHFKGIVRRVCNLIRRSALATRQLIGNTVCQALAPFCPLEFVLRFAISISSNLPAPFSMRDCSRRTGVLAVLPASYPSNTAPSSSISTRAISLHYSLFIQLLSFTFT
jgi:hypothetical protein